MHGPSVICADEEGLNASLMRLKLVVPVITPMQTRQSATSLALTSVIASDSELIKPTSMGFLKDKLGKLHIGGDHDGYGSDQRRRALEIPMQTNLLPCALAHCDGNLQCMKPRGICKPSCKQLAYPLINPNIWVCAAASRKLTRSPGVASPAC